MVLRRKAALFLLRARRLALYLGAPSGRYHEAAGGRAVPGVPFPRRLALDRQYGEPRVRRRPGGGEESGDLRHERNDGQYLDDQAEARLKREQSSRYFSTRINPSDTPPVDSLWKP